MICNIATWRMYVDLPLYKKAKIDIKSDRETIFFLIYISYYKTFHPVIMVIPILNLLSEHSTRIYPKLSLKYWDNKIQIIQFLLVQMWCHYVT